MKIAISFPQCHRRGGIERAVLETANFLAGRGHDVHLCACRWDAKLLDPRVTCHAVEPLRALSPLPAIAFALRSRRVVAAIDAPITAAFGAYCPPNGVFWAGSVHRAWLAVSQRQRGFAGRLKQYLNPFHPVMLAFENYYMRGRRYRRLIAYTAQVKSDFMRFYNVPECDITIIPLGYSPAEFNLARRQSLRQAARSRLGFADTDKLILFVANELARKGFGPLIHAMRDATKANERLVAVGRFSPAGYKHEIQALGLANRIIFPGPTDDVAQLYAAADCFALPTQYEAWGLVIVEALACGTPVLTSRLAGAAGAVREGHSGLLLDDPNSVAEISAKLRRLLDGEHADPESIAASVTHLSWPNVLLDYERVLIECADA